MEHPNADDPSPLVIQIDSFGTTVTEGPRWCCVRCDDIPGRLGQGDP